MRTANKDQLTASEIRAAEALGIVVTAAGPAEIVSEPQHQSAAMGNALMTTDPLTQRVADLGARLVIEKFARPILQDDGGAIYDLRYASLDESAALSDWSHAVRASHDAAQYIDSREGAFAWQMIRAGADYCVRFVDREA